MVTGEETVADLRSGNRGPSRWRPGFGEYLFGGIIALMLFGALLAVFLYLVPPEHLELAELQPAYRVKPAAEFPVGASQVVHWGDRIILVIHTGAQEYTALDGTSPTDGCILEWDESSLRVLSPCTHIVYDLHGNVVKGLTTVPLHRYPVFVRQGVVYVGRA